MPSPVLIATLRLISLAVPFTNPQGSSPMLKDATSMRHIKRALQVSHGLQLQSLWRKLLQL